MPQYDLYHNQVKNALTKDGWVITDDPFILEYKGLRLYADLGAEKLFAAQKMQQKIVIEIKVFNSPSLISELEKTLGQYNIYVSLIKRINPERKLYLAIPEAVYQDFFLKPAIQEGLLKTLISITIF
ncbi:MAG: element excision factor XisH family protein, partial [Dolichospermum sp.]